MARQNRAKPPVVDEGNGISRSRTRWRQDPEGVRQNILVAARDAFVESGFAGARVDDIAARTQTSKRMIYYYFGDKQGLYLAVLEEAYAGIRNHERELDLSILPPRQALEALTAETFDYHARNPDFVRLVMVENIHHAESIARSDRISRLNLSAIETIREIHERGVATGDFRPDLSALDIHLTISALSFYNVSNRWTIRALFGHDMGEAEAQARRRKDVVEAVMRYVAAEPEA